jgi:hypothetical protein
VSLAQKPAIDAGGADLCLGFRTEERPVNWPKVDFLTFLCRYDEMTLLLLVAWLFRFLWELISMA